MKRNLILAGGVLLVVLIIVFAFTGGEKDGSADIIVEAKKGRFLVEIVTTGELEAKNSVEILGPNLRNHRIRNINIQHIIDEGTVIKKGAYVATLDPSELTNMILDQRLNLEKIESQFIQTQLDTALQMRQARNELINLKYAVEEREIILEQSKFEPPATIKQAEIEVDKAQRGLQQAKENYKIKESQNVAKMREVATSRRKQQSELDAMLEVQKSFVITAPEDGMLIYRKGWDGKPIKEGSQINSWDPVVATLPDLSVMMSKTYVNEVDVRKVKAGQHVDIGLDAFPDKKLRGIVRSVANVGEQRPNSDAKVFQVNIEVVGTDNLLRPAMTTSNIINVEDLEDVVYVPLEALHNAYDSITFVYKKEGLNLVRQEIIIGTTNANEAVVEKGLSEGDMVYLSIPGNTNESFALLPELDGKRNHAEDQVNETIEADTRENKTRKPGRRRSN